MAETPETSTPKQAVRIWDLPLRIFKWAFAIAIVAAIISPEGGDLTLHAQIGYVVMVLLIFRILWGIVGSETARFSSFLRPPGEVVTYAKTGIWRGLGHNPLGGLSVIAILAVVAFKVVTGLFSNDDIFFDGPWAGWIGKETSDMLTGLHDDATTVLYVLIGLHIAAVAWHEFRGDRLIEPMIRGRKRLPPEMVAKGEKLGFTPLLVAVPVLALSAFLAGIAMRYWIL